MAAWQHSSERVQGAVKSKHVLPSCRQIKLVPSAGLPAAARPYRYREVNKLQTKQVTKRNKGRREKET